MHPRHGFSLIELVVVIALVLGIWGLVLPALQAVQAQGRRARSQLQMQQYVQACLAYRTDRGHWPDCGQGGAEVALRQHTVAFAEILGGRGVDGGAFTTALARRGNPEGRVYHRFSEAEWAPREDPHAGCLVDACGNPNLYLVFDHDDDGWIRPQDFAAMPPDLRPPPMRAAAVMYTLNPDAERGWEWSATWR
jgi:prepilin-type N-terminal cleavage/methylation domain-containing protein